MKKILLCASVLSLVAAVPLAAHAGSYTATAPDASSGVAAKVEAAEKKAKEALMKALGEDPAGEDDQVLTFEEKLHEFNGGNTVLVETRDLLKGRVADREGKAIGEVKDAFVSEGGQVEGITASLGRLSLSGEVFLATREMSLEGSSKGYAIGLSGTEVKGIFSEIPKGAPDSQGGKILSAKEFAGRDVKTKKEKDFGEIVDILFSEEGTKAEAVLMKISYGTVRNAVVAVPMEALEFETKRGRPSFVIKSSMAADVLKFATEQAGK